MGIFINGIWIRTTLNGKIEVLVEYESHWHLVFNEKYGDNISHIVEPLGMIGAPLDPVTNLEDSWKPEKLSVAARLGTNPDPIPSGGGRALPRRLHRRSS